MELRNDPAFQPTWKNRKRVIFGTLGYSAILIAYLAIWGEDNKVNETIAMGLLLLDAGVIGSYVFGAVWQDRGMMQMRQSSYSTYDTYDDYGPSEHTYNGPAMPPPPERY